MGTPTTALMNISRAMVCKATARTKCKTPTACESQGECHGGLRKEYCYRTTPQDDTTWTCEQFAHVCVKPQRAKPGQFHKDCAIYYQLTPPATYDDRVHWMGNKCVDLHDTTASICSANGGTWTSTFNNRTICEKDKVCESPRGDEFRFMPAATCTSCGYTQKPMATWDAAKRQLPAMVASDVGDRRMVWSHAA